MTKDFKTKTALRDYQRKLQLQGWKVWSEESKETYIDLVMISLITNTKILLTWKR